MKLGRTPRLLAEAARLTKPSLVSPARTHRYLKLTGLCAILLATWMPSSAEVLSLLSGQTSKGVMFLLSVGFGRPPDELRSLLEQAAKQQAFLLIACSIALLLVHFLSLHLSSIAAFSWVEALLGKEFEIVGSLKRHAAHGTFFFALKIFLLCLTVGSAGLLIAAHMDAVWSVRLAWGIALWLLVNWISLMLPIAVVVRQQSFSSSLKSVCLMVARHPLGVLETLIGLFVIRVAQIFWGFVVGLLGVFFLVLGGLLHIVPAMLWMNISTSSWRPAIEAVAAFDPLALALMALLALFGTVVGYAAFMIYTPVQAWEQIYGVLCFTDLQSDGEASGGDSENG